ncbi:class I SAM-dependent methyltransferase [Aquabacterium sp. OR-4]|uniref:class I SAM-dependent methyltransferase n=1 Tax=Aquabacterium sp. OR-4 TaxID=2978127 RepID=UPI0028C9CF70|nr:class I SAM-dependent methyltransferase [Aquabacterium sp. OR-4]MDT7834477.1 class I SAM-dependent methyltransferase [Aquabacterium sp. OR-4]
MTGHNAKHGAEQGAETAAVAARYARRAGLPADRYSLLRPEVWQMVQERQRAMLRLLVRAGLTDLPSLRVLEVGCGAGGNLLELLRLGFAPAHLSGAELLPERLAQARAVLPAAVALHGGDASTLDIAPDSQHIVLQSTVFSSLLDDAFQQRLADAMWHWVAPGGGVLWYDFTVDNPRNPDVRGMPLARVQRLFPQARITHRRVTLAPPIARAVCPLHPGLYPVFNALPLLRTHVLAWLEKTP